MQFSSCFKVKMRTSYYEVVVLQLKLYIPFTNANASFKF